MESIGMMPNGNARQGLDGRTPYGQRLLPQIIDSSAADDPARLVGMIAKSTDISQGFTKVTIGETALAVNYMAWWIEEHVGSSKDFETVAYLGPNDFRFWAVVFGGIKCSKKILLPSARNSLTNNLSLLDATGCKTVICASSLQSMAEELKSEADVNVFVAPSWDEIVASPAKHYPYTKTWEEARNDQIIVLHTSGSTGNPKPIIYNHAFLAFFDSLRLVPSANGLKASNVSTVDVGPEECFYMCFPLFHLVGLAFSMFPILYHGIVVFGPPYGAQNSNIAIEIMTAISFTTIIMPPSLLEDIIKDYGQDFEANSTRLRLIYYGGGPLAQSTGEYLSKFIPGMAQIYGQTEIAMPPILLPKPEDWSYFQWHPTHSGIDMEPTGDEEDHFELVLNRNSKMLQFQPVFENFPHLNHWRTKDLFQKHPTKPDLWLFKGRRDDTIVLSNAEKFNPVSMEGFILGHEAVKGVLVVGTGNFQCALIIEPKSHDCDNNVVGDVWPVVEKANAEAPNYAQIDRRLIMMSKPEKPFHRAGKGTVMRYATTTNYTEEIEQLYEAYGRHSISKVTLDAPHDSIAVKRFVRRVMEEHLDGKVFDDDTDFFILGIDSLKTSQIANGVQVSLQPHLCSSMKIPGRTLYENPSTSKLSDALYRFLHPTEAITNRYSKNGIYRGSDLMKALLDEYTANLPATPKNLMAHKHQNKLNVILTGSTGSLGSYILADLLKDPKIGAIYCLDRSADAEEIVLKKREFLVSQVDTSSTSRIRWTKVDFSDPSFGLSESLLDELLESVDVIIHNAWKVDFNYSLSTFTPQIAGVRNFASFCIRSPLSPKLFFISSISALGNWSTLHPLSQSVPETVPDDFNLAAQMGYGESKHVSERILDEIAQSIDPFMTNFNILRVGQIAGPSAAKRGRWNESEWFPSLIQTSKELDILPETLGTYEMVDWIPVDELAGIILDIVHSSSISTPPENRGGASVYNLTNPSRVPFRSFIPGIKAHLGSEMNIVDFAEWIKELENLDRDDEKILARYPVLKILEFFQGLNAKGERKSVVFETERARMASERMRKLGPITDEMMSIWMEGWGL